MLDKLEGIYNRWQDIGEMMNDPNVMADMKKFIKLNKDYKELQPIVDAYKEYANVLANIDSTHGSPLKEKIINFFRWVISKPFKDPGFPSMPSEIT